MTNKFKLTFIFAIIIFATNSFAQTNKEIALRKGNEAIKLEDEKGLYDDAIKLFEEAEKLDPENISYPYEKAFALSSKKEYKKASDILEKLINHKDVNQRVYQALGNAYDEQGKSELAKDTYNKGLEKFPNSGELYLELGNLNLAKRDYNNAITYYEKGLEVDPKFPSNYYWASKLYCSSSERVWGMIYGELFMNLERNSKRTAEISKLLYDTYFKAFEFTSETKDKRTINYSFSTIGSKENPLPEPKKGEKFKLPYGIGVYEPTIGVTLIDITKIDLSSLNTIRKGFIENYIEKNLLKEYPNVLFEYQNKILKAGHFEAYNYWLLMKGNEDEFGKWKSKNENSWNEFVNWFKENKMPLDRTNNFYRNQYE